MKDARPTGPKSAFRTSRLTSCCRQAAKRIAIAPLLSVLRFVQAAASVSRAISVKLATTIQLIRSARRRCVLVQVDGLDA